MMKVVYFHFLNQSFWHFYHKMAYFISLFVKHISYPQTGDRQARTNNGRAFVLIQCFGLIVLRIHSDRFCLSFPLSQGFFECRDGPTVRLTVSPCGIPAPPLGGLGPTQGVGAGGDRLRRSGS